MYGDTYYSSISTWLPVFYIAFFSGVACPKCWGRGGRRGSGMVPFETALVSFYRLSIVTFPLSLRISEILLLLFSSMPVFPYPTSNLPKISPCSPRNRWIAFWLQRVKVLGKLCVQLVSKISNLCDHNPPTLHRWTDGHAIARPRFALKCIER